MAACCFQYQASEREVEGKEVSFENNTRETWLHGWPRMGTRVLIGTGVYCVGCGKDGGITTVAFDSTYEHWVKDRPYPDWPFDKNNCPVCYLSDLYLNQASVREYVQIGKDGMALRSLRERLPK